MLEWELPNFLVVWIVYHAILLINMTPRGTRIDPTPAYEIMQRRKISLQHEARFRFGETVYAVNPNSVTSSNALKDRHTICIFLTSEENSFVLYNLTSGQLIRRDNVYHGRCTQTVIDMMNAKALPKKKKRGRKFPL